MESNFRSTVLQRPSTHDDEMEHRGPGHRDILNPAPMSPQPRHSFSLRSPTQPDYHRQYSPVSSNTQRSSLHNPFMAAPTGAALSSNASGPISPLHAPSASYYSSAPRDDYPRDTKPASRGFYDPTTDTTKERRVSDAAPTSSWHTATGLSTAPQVSQVGSQGISPLDMLLVFETL